ncbi:ABC transporter permease [bacterium]|nr:ABC transporter permease [candidate division CSSED10-310 bacterium]
MSVPLIYNIRSIRLRWVSALVAILSIAGVVAVFVAVMAMAQGFQKTLVSSGLERNAMILRGGAGAEMESVLTLDQVKIMGDAPQVLRNGDGRPVISPEVVVIAAFQLKETGTDANVQVRGVSDQALEVRQNVRIAAGRFFRTGLPELVAGKNAALKYRNLDLGDTVKLGGATWTVVGIMDAGGTAFDSELWCDASILNQTFQRPENIFQSMTAALVSPDALSDFKDVVSTDPRLTVTVYREPEYYAKQSQMVATMIRVLGFLVAFVMGIGAVFGALNTMYAMVSARTHEIATLRAIGFRSGNIIVSFLMESLFIAGLGGILGLIVILPINGKVASTMNWQTFSHMSFAFDVTLPIMVQGLVFALFMGFFGGLVPAFRAARVPVAGALRGL